MKLSFEEAFERLEHILERMNSGKAHLEESLKLFEEAEGLIRECSALLTSSEQKIQALVKQRGQVVLDTAQKPRVESFSENPGLKTWDCTLAQSPPSAHSDLKDTAFKGRVSSPEDKAMNELPFS